MDKGVSGATEQLDGTEQGAELSMARPSPPYLQIVASDGTWTSLPLPTGGGFTIGRDVGADVRIHERAVSRRHARLEVTDTGEFRLIDLGSANGSRVGASLVRRDCVIVQPGEPILIGRTVMTVHVPPAVSAAQEGAWSSQAPPPPLSPPPLPGLALAEVDAMVVKAAPTMISVLLLGETGVGKDVVAERLHRLSARASGPLVRLNCAGLSAALLESELFGYERGAFTGAAQAKPGLLEAAAGGTVFLDEIGEMPLEVQAKLLLAIEQRITRRLGSTRSVSIDVRFLSATHRDIEAEIRRDQFRADFYYRINGLTIRIPPLRERRNEIEGLIAQFADEAARRLGRARLPIFDEGAREKLHRHDWPGNIRELRNVIERAILLSESHLITSRVLTAAGLSGDTQPLRVLIPSQDAERERVIATLADCGGNQSRAARLLGMSRNTLIARIRRYGLARPHQQGNVP